jgi:hypothetical protein
VAAVQVPDEDRFLPLVLGSSFTLIGLGSLLVWPWKKLKRQRAERFLETGLPAIGTVRSVQDTGVTINDNPRVTIQFWIEPQNGSAPYQGEKTMTVSRLSIPFPGQRVPLLIDPTNRDSFALIADAPDDLSGLPPHVQRLVMSVRQDGGFVDATRGHARGNQETLDELARLNQLRQAGALTEAEFETLKARLLRNMSG